MYIELYVLYLHETVDSLYTTIYRRWLMIVDGEYVNVTDTTDHEPENSRFTVKTVQSCICGLLG